MSLRLGHPIFGLILSGGGVPWVAALVQPDRQFKVGELIPLPWGL